MQPRGVDAQGGGPIQELIRVGGVALEQDQIERAVDEPLAACPAHLSDQQEGAEQEQPGHDRADHMYAMTSEEPARLGHRRGPPGANGFAGAEPAAILGEGAGRAVARCGLLFEALEDNRPRGRAAAPGSAAAAEWDRRRQSG